MKNRTILVLLQIISSLISGILISKMSFIGRMGITFIYNEYTIFKTWWKTAIIMGTIQIFLFVILYFFRVKFYDSPIRVIAAIVFFFLGLVGLYFTYIDFTETSHRLMKFSFHAGFYLFWFTWLVTCLYFIFLQNKQDKIENNLSLDS